MHYKVTVIVYKDEIQNLFVLQNKTYFSCPSSEYIDLKLLLLLRKISKG